MRYFPIEHPWTYPLDTLFLSLMFSRCYLMAWILIRSMGGLDNKPPCTQTSFLKGKTCKMPALHAFCRSPLCLSTFLVSHRVWENTLLSPTRPTSSISVYSSTENSSLPSRIPVVSIYPLHSSIVLQLLMTVHNTQEKLSWLCSSPYRHQWETIGMRRFGGNTWKCRGKIHGHCR